MVAGCTTTIIVNFYEVEMYDVLFYRVKKSAMREKKLQSRIKSLINNAGRIGTL